MALKVPPPPPMATSNPQFNRWLLELTSILSDQGGIDPSEVAGLPELITQVATNTTDIATLETGQGGQGTAIATLESDVITINTEIVTINGQITTLSARAQPLNGVGVPNPGLGNVNDWYANIGGGAGARIYVKTAVGTWTPFPF